LLQRNLSLIPFGIGGNPQFSAGRKIPCFYDKHLLSLQDMHRISIMLLRTWKTTGIWLFLILLCGNAFGQSAEMRNLEQKIYNWNNHSECDRSVDYLMRLLNQDSLNNSDRYYANLYLSYTYKRLFDYPSALKRLDKALFYGRKTQNPEFYENNIKCQKALIYFDIQKYPLARQLMQDLEKDRYRHLNNEYQSKIMMQQAYLFYLDEKFREAEALYEKAVKKMLLSSPCDLPMIYGKQIQLYGAMHEDGKMMRSYELAMKSSDSCGIIKYKMYALEMLKNSFAEQGRYEKYYQYIRIYDSIVDQYNAVENINKIRELEVKYNTRQKQADLVIERQAVSSSKRLIALLISLLAVTVLLIALYITIQRRKKLTRDRENSLRHTRSLLARTEDERKRIASDLHDSVNHDLTYLKHLIDDDPTFAKNKVDQVIEDIRIISRNLHPALFETLGLKQSIEVLAERIQTQHDLILITEMDYANRLSVTDELQIYRIVQEAINNMVKYSGAMAGKILIRETPDKLILEIRDSGTGFDVEKVLENKDSFGLHMIMERSKALNGIAKITSDKYGTVIYIEIHLKHENINRR
jgi:signal transduction histidine kinase